MTDTLTTFKVTGTDSVAAKSDVATHQVASSYTETVAAKSDAATAKASGITESLAAKGDSQTNTVDAWATATATSGTAPTSPANAQGRNDAATATVKAGGVAAGTSQLVLSGYSPPAGGNNPELRLYYQTVAGTTDTFTIAYTPGGSTEVVVHSDATARNFLASPEVISLTGLSATQLSGLTIRFTHAASVPSTGGQISVDAASIRKAGVL